MDSEGYASDAVDLGSSSGNGYCSASDGLDRLNAIRSIDSEHIGCIPEHWPTVRTYARNLIALIAYLSVRPHVAL